MADKAHRWTDKKLKSLEKRINAEYAQAEAEVAEKIRDYYKRYETKDKKWRSWVRQGVKTEKEYQEWRTGQLAVGERWERMKDELAADYHNANDIAKKIAYDTAKNVYAENYNYSTYEIEKGLELDTGFTLYDKDTIERILRDDPSLLPEPGKKVSSMIAAGLDMRWNRQIIQSAVIQGILQGESIPKIATRLAASVGDKNRKAAIRNARTMITGAQNAGRVESYKRAQRMGIDLKQQWVATLDGRTRHEHRLLDGQTVKVGEPFHVEGMTIRFPGDPTAPARLVYNCRCTLISQLKGFEIDSTRYRQDPDLGGMTYEEWKHAKEAKSNPITLPEEKERNIKGAYIKEYRDNMALKGAVMGEANSGDSDMSITNKLASLLDVDSENINISMLPVESQESIYRAVEKCVNKVPQLKGWFKEIDFEADLGKNVMANSSSFKGVVRVSDYYSDFDNLKDIYEWNVQVLNSPVGTDVDAIIIHEIGHQIDGLMTTKGLYGGSLEYGEYRTSIKVQHDILDKLGYYDYIKESREDLSQRYSGKELTEMLETDRKLFIKERVSEYAAENNKEFFAECFAEYMQSDNPREAAREFGRIFEELIGEL